MQIKAQTPRRSTVAGCVIRVLIDQGMGFELTLANHKLSYVRSTLRKVGETAVLPLPVSN
jgi:hypothetical protein